MISNVEKTVALLTALTPADLVGMPPAARRRFADLCRRVAEIAEPRETPKAGVLACLRDGARYE